MRRTIVALSTLSFLAMPTVASAGGGCHADGPARERAATRVVIGHACFEPTVASVAPGTAVAFVNQSGMPHNITGPAVEFTELPDGTTHTVTFAQPGIYVYACMIHPGMSGAVVVRGNAAAPAAPVAEPASALSPVARTSGSGGGSGTGWAAAALATLVAAAVVLRSRAA